jgi:hypothetical protein
MSAETGNPRELPRMVVVLVVIATGAATVWAATKMGPLGPYTSWERAQQAVQQVWSRPAQGVQMPAAQAAPPVGVSPANGFAPQRAWGSVPVQSPPESPPSAALPDALFGSPEGAAARTVGLPGVPAILWGTPRPHRDRGPCTNCHTVATGDGQRVPTIFSFSAMPHEYRGVCNNCHQISVSGFGGNLVAGIRAAEPLNDPRLMQAAPNEAEWRGMEVRAGAEGVVVVKADGTAAVAGVQAGDVVESINGVPVRSIADFAQVTENGELRQGTMISSRTGQRVAFELQPAQQGASMSPPMSTGAQLPPMAPQAMAGQSPMALAPSVPSPQPLPQQPMMAPSFMPQAPAFMPQAPAAPQSSLMQPGLQPPLVPQLPLAPQQFFQQPLAPQPMSPQQPAMTPQPFVPYAAPPGWGAPAAPGFGG